jgi:mersacidin/lichenicidin family type 2 lantibiotic
MSPFDVVRAWKDPEYRHSLSDTEKQLLPSHPSGLIELMENDLGQIGGGWWGLATDQYGWGLYLKHCYEDNDRQMSVCTDTRII